MTLIDSRPGLRSPTKGLLPLIALLALNLAACSGGSSPAGEPAPPAPVASCNPSDPATAAECGTLILGLTDADGDFLSYAVDVVSLTLERADGSIVETLPTGARIDFTEYTDLTEFVTAALVPPGVYVAGRITLDYAAAEVLVEAAGEAKAAIVVGEDGTPLTRADFRIVLSDRDRLQIVRGLPSLLSVDFDLDASHSVDVAPSPAVAVASPFIVAEILPVDSKDFRLRGLLVETNAAEMTYTVAIRPFHLLDGEFGRAAVLVSDTTEFEVNGDTFTGVDGLRALQAAGPRTPTIALGTLDVAAREFTARLVLAGSSVPGVDIDAAWGNVISRSSDSFVVRGGTVQLADQRPFFHRDITVTIGPDTKIFRTGFDGPLDGSTISVGQNVVVRGDVSVSDTGIRIDATAGAVRMNVTHLAGIVNAAVPGQLDIELHAIDRRRVGIFDFTGTGTGPETDADPANYEVATGNLLLANQAIGRPVLVYGFPNAFGAAPPDFTGRTVVDFAGVRSVLGVGWGAAGTAAPFLSIGNDGLVLDNHNPDIDLRHYIKQGPVLVDLTGLDSGTLIVPLETGRMLFVLKTGDSLQLYADFADFASALADALAAGGTARSMFARGLYESDGNRFVAYRIGVHILEP